MIAISWFAGIGGFDRALRRAGHEVVGACEIDPFARKVYSARLGAPTWFPEDIRDVKAATIPEADLWCGGFPCQDVSVAGLWRGIHGERSGLVWRLLALARERRPAYILLENVPGLLSGADGDLDGDDVGGPTGGPVSWLGALLGGLAESGYVDGAWRVLDARWFVPQRRARVFILARRAGAGGRHPAEVLLEPARVRGNPTARRAAGEDLAGCLEARAGRGGYGTSADEAAGGHLIPTITASAGHHGRSSPCGDASDALIAFDRAQITSGENRSICREGDPAPSLHSEASLLAYQQHGSDVGRFGGLRAGRGDVQSGVPFLAFSAKDHGQDAGEIAPTLRAMPHDGSHANGGGQVAVTFIDEASGFNAFAKSGAGGNGYEAGVSPPVRGSNPPATTAGVRRLTATECEKLQGFPPGWTCLCGCAPYSTRACSCADGPRYRALGNAVCVDVVEWIARRLDGYA